MANKTHFLFALFFLTLSATFNGLAVEAQPKGQPTQSEIMEMMCKQTICQRNLHVALKNKDGSSFDKTFKEFPAIVQNEGILVVAGQTVYVEAELSKDQLINLHAVDAIAHPEKTITVKLEQMPDGGMMLVTTNPFDVLLKFDMGIMPPESDNLLKTSSCPVMKSSYEMWPHPIFQAYLGNGHVVAKDNTACD